MAATLKLYVDWFAKKLVTSKTSAASFSLPTFYYGEVFPFQITLLEPNPAVGWNGYAVVNNANIGLKLIVSSVAVDTGTTLATQYSWTKDTVEMTFSAEVGFNTAAIDTWLSTDATKTAYLEIQITEGTVVSTVYKTAITIGASQLTPSTQQVPAGETPLSQEVAKAMFVQKMMGAGESITLTSADGTKQGVLYWGDDGVLHADSL